MLLFLGFRQNVSRETFCFLFFQLLIAKYILIYLKYDDAMGKRSESRCKLACKRIFALSQFGINGVKIPFDPNIMLFQRQHRICLIPFCILQFYIISHIVLDDLNKIDYRYIKNLI